MATVLNGVSKGGTTLKLFFIFKIFLNKLTQCSTALSEMIQLSYKCLMKADKHSLSAPSGASGITNVSHSRVHTLATYVG